MRKICTTVLEEQFEFPPSDGAEEQLLATVDHVEQTVEMKPSTRGTDSATFDIAQIPALINWLGMIHNRARAARDLLTKLPTEAPEKMREG